MAKKKETETNFNKDTKELNEETSRTLIKDVVATISDKYNLPKLYQIGLMSQAGYSTKDIAIILDTSQRYATNCVSKIKRESKTRQRLAEIIASMPDWFRASRQATLPVLAAAQNKAAQMYLDQPGLLIDKPQLAKQMLMAAGVKTDEERPITHLKIKTAIQVQNVLAADQAPQRIEAIDIEEEDAE